MSTKLKEILSKNGPYPTPLNPDSSQAKADPDLAPAMFYWFEHFLGEGKVCLFVIGEKDIKKIRLMLGKLKRIKKSLWEAFIKGKKKKIPKYFWGNFNSISSSWTLKYLDLFTFL